MTRPNPPTSSGKTVVLSLSDREAITWIGDKAGAVASESARKFLFTLFGSFAILLSVLLALGVSELRRIISQSVGEEVEVAMSAAQAELLVGPVLIPLLLAEMRRLEERGGFDDIEAARILADFDRVALVEDDIPAGLERLIHEPVGQAAKLFASAGRIHDSLELLRKFDPAVVTWPSAVEAAGLALFLGSISRSDMPIVYSEVFENLSAVGLDPLSDEYEYQRFAFLAEEFAAADWNSTAIQSLILEEATRWPDFDDSMQEILFRARPMFGWGGPLETGLSKDRLNILLAALLVTMADPVSQRRTSVD